VRLLLDTQAALWFTEDSDRLTQPAIDAIEDPVNVILLSAVVPWEVAIKRALGRIDTTDEYLRLLRVAGAVDLPITIAHVQAVEHLPHHHSDPFDRLLIAQAHVEDATIVTGDSRFATYEMPVIW
jgi:PIN domain nuclease of toxin-antitoxin system